MSKYHTAFYDHVSDSIDIFNKEIIEKNNELNIFFTHCKLNKVSSYFDVVSPPKQDISKYYPPVLHLTHISFQNNNGFEEIIDLNALDKSEYLKFYHNLELS